MSSSVSAEGRELIAAWTLIDRGMSEWVLKLADFDRSGAWAEDGFHSCVSWLAEQCGLGRSAAYEKLRVAHELTRRHVVREAFEAGLSYTKARLLVCLEGVDDERDEKFVEHANIDSMRLLEQRVKNWNYYATQDKPPANVDDHYGIRRERGFGDGLGRMVIEAPDEMLDRLTALLDAYGEFLFHNHNGERAQVGLKLLDDAMDDAVDESTTWTDPAEAQPAPATDTKKRPLSARRLDWLLDLFEEVALSEPKKLDPYVAAVGVTIQYEDLIAGTGAGLSAQGSVLTGEAVRRLCCDAGIHRVVVKGVSEILDFGREERLFNRAMRRAIRFRHGHTCAVRGCGRRITHIHHTNWWEHGGETNIALGLRFAPITITSCTTAAGKSTGTHRPESSGSSDPAGRSSKQPPASHRDWSRDSARNRDLLSRASLIGLASIGGGRRPRASGRRGHVQTADLLYFAPLRPPSRTA